MFLNTSPSVIDVKCYEQVVKCLCNIVEYNVDEEMLCNLRTKNELANGIGGNEDVSDLEIFAKSAALLVQKDDLEQWKICLAAL